MCLELSYWKLRQMLIIIQLWPKLQTCCRVTQLSAHYKCILVVRIRVTHTTRPSLHTHLNSPLRLPARRTLLWVQFVATVKDLCISMQDFLASFLGLTQHLSIAVVYYVLYLMQVINDSQVKHGNEARTSTPKTAHSLLAILLIKQRISLQALTWTSHSSILRMGTGP